MNKTALLLAGVIILVSTPAFAKINLAGGVWTTYWAQQEASAVRIQTNTGGAWNEQVGMTTIGPGQTATFGGGPRASKKTFFLAQDISGAGLTGEARANRGYGFALVADCPINDWAKAYGLFASTNAGVFTMNYGWLQLDFAPAAALRAGLFKVAFGNEGQVVTSVGKEEMFLSNYSQDPMGALQSNREVGAALIGKLFDNTLSYQAFVFNGSLRTVADSTAAQVGPNTVDANDAKMIGLYTKWTPLPGLHLGGSYAGGDYTANFATSNSHPRFTGYTLFGGYDVANVLLLTGEYATVRHDQMTLDFQGGATPATGTRETSRVNEYILKAIYDGIQDWELGVRYAVIDPKNLEAEVGAGYTSEKKITFGSQWQFVKNARLKMEYSMIITDLNYLDKYDAAAVPAGATRITPSEEPDDDIFAVQLDLQFENQTPPRPRNCW